MPKIGSNEKLVQNIDILGFFCLTLWVRTLYLDYRKIYEDTFPGNQSYMVRQEDSTELREREDKKIHDQYGELLSKLIIYCIPFHSYNDVFVNSLEI